MLEKSSRHCSSDHSYFPILFTPAAHTTAPVLTEQKSRRPHMYTFLLVNFSQLEQAI
jgi:hypothetical protein